MSTTQQPAAPADTVGTIVEILTAVETIAPAVQGIAAIVQKVISGGGIAALDQNDLATLSTLSDNLDQLVAQAEASAGLPATSGA